MITLEQRHTQMSIIEEPMDDCAQRTTFTIFWHLSLREKETRYQPFRIRLAALKTRLTGIRQTRARGSFG